MKLEFPYDARIAYIREWTKRLKLPEHITSEAERFFNLYTDPNSPTWKGAFTHKSNLNVASWNKYDLAATCILIAAKTDPLCEPIVLRDMSLPHEKGFTLRNRVAKYYRELMRIDDTKPQSCTLNPAIYLDRIAAGLGIADNVELKEHALDLVKKVKEKSPLRFVSRQPISVMATAIYMACVVGGIPITQRMVANAAGITPVTIRNHYHMFRDVLSSDELFLWKNS